MITQSNKKIKKQQPPTLHLHLHSPTPHERRPRPNNQRQIMRSQPRLCIWCVGVCKARTGQDRAAGYVCVQALFSEGEALEDWEVVLLGGAAVLYRY